MHIASCMLLLQWDFCVPVCFTSRVASSVDGVSARLVTLVTAAGQGHLDVMQWLIENGANISIQNSAGENPKDIARRFAQLPAIRILGGEDGECGRGAGR